MNKLLTILVCLTCFISCASASRDQSQNQNQNIEEILDRAEANSSVSGRKILEASRSMISNQDIVVGGCWDYINTVYNRAGYSTNQRATVFKSKLKGPYVKADPIEPGDWLYFVNHSYGDIEHSAIFVAWTDEEKKIALTVSYVGGDHRKPAAYKKFDIGHIYNIIRPQD